MRLHDLPDDILILIIRHTTLPTLLSLRLTTRYIRAVIDSYMNTLAPVVARNTFPNATQLLKPPKNGNYSIHWLRNLIPRQLATIALDKDKLRRYCYINSGFLYGIPAESDSEDAVHWRERIANGWRVLRCFYLISRDVYANASANGYGHSDSNENLLTKSPSPTQSPSRSQSPHSSRQRAKTLRKLSTNASRVWQTVSCPYQGCSEHGVRSLFASKSTTRRNSSVSSTSSSTPGRPSTPELPFQIPIRRLESQILKTRLAYLDTLPTRDLLDYIYLHRLLFWVFRPYRKPGTSATDSLDGLDPDTPSASDWTSSNWRAETSALAFGNSWLNWWLLHAGSAPFWKQWCNSGAGQDDTADFFSYLNPALRGKVKEQRANKNANYIRNLVHATYTSRSPHRREVEREHVAKFEFALRKRCLSPDRLKRLEAEILHAGANHTPVMTISLECIPWQYDMLYIVYKRPGEFPWYRAGEWVWMDGDVWVRNGGQEMDMSVVVRRGWAGAAREDEGERRKTRAGLELEGVPYLVYLGVKSARDVWGRTDLGATGEMVF